MSWSARQSIELGRKLADIADLFDRLSFLRIEVHATSIGPVTQMHIGIMGLWRR